MNLQLTVERMALSLALLWVPWVAQAQEAPDRWSYKLTPSFYSNSNQHAAWDTNLRGNYGSHTVWLGHFAQGSDADTEKFQQTRAGYEYTMPMPFGVLVPSLQVATSGFIGGSLSAQIGRPDAYALLGFGRTNLHAYYNLNFDPNDAITVGYAQRLPDQSMLTAYYLWDDRLATSQKVAHLVWRKPLNDTQRLTVDFAVKKGRPKRVNRWCTGTSFPWAWTRVRCFSSWRLTVRSIFRAPIKCAQQWVFVFDHRASMNRAIRW